MAFMQKQSDCKYVEPEKAKLKDGSLPLQKKPAKLSSVLFYFIILSKWYWISDWKPYKLNSTIASLFHSHGLDFKEKNCFYAR